MNRPPRDEVLPCPGQTLKRETARRKETRQLSKATDDFSLFDATVVGKSAAARWYTRAFPIPNSVGTVVAGSL